MTELSLFSGAGGGLLASKLLGWKTIGYVEFNKYCQQIIRQRIDDGILDDAPIFGNIRAFNAEGFAESYTGLVDVISAGFPCQPFSVAGKRAGEADSRNMWPETIRSIRGIRPKYAFLENVPGLLATRYFGRILGDLAEMRYSVRWCCFSAAGCGAPHIRKRIWILADASRVRRRRWDNENGEKGAIQTTRPSRSKKPPILADAESQRSGRHFKPAGAMRENVPYAEMSGRERPDAEGNTSTSRRPGEFGRWDREVSWWAVESNVGRVVNGLANRVDRLKAIGNGQVPAVAAKAFRYLVNPE